MYWLQYPYTYCTKERNLPINKRILIVGLFAKSAKQVPTQALVLAGAMQKRGVELITTSRYINKWKRLLDIVFTMFTKASGYDVAIIQFYSGNSFIWQYIAAYIALLLNKKIVMTVHGGNVPVKLNSSIGNRYKKLLKKADLITVPSAFMQQELKKHDTASLLIENIIELSDYQFREKNNVRPSILWMRAFSDIYNPLMAVHVVNRLKVNYPDVKMVMAGPDLGMLSVTKELCTKLGLEKNIDFAGFINNQQKNQLADDCDIYISTNRVDNAPVSFLEMWAMGIPVVSTAVGGVPYLLQHGVTGMIAKDDDVQSMVEAIVSLVENPALSLSIIRNAKIKVAVYDEENVYRKWEEVINSL